MNDDGPRSTGINLGDLARERGAVPSADQMGSATPPPAAPAGWYVDPATSRQRYWDGAAWLDIPEPPTRTVIEDRPRPSTPLSQVEGTPSATEPSPRPWLGWAIVGGAAVVVAAVLAVVATAGGHSGGHSDSKKDLGQSVTDLADRSWSRILWINNPTFTFTCPQVTPEQGASVVCQGYISDTNGKKYGPVTGDVTFQDSAGAYTLTIDYTQGTTPPVSGHL